MAKVSAMKPLGQRIRALRKAKGVTLIELSETTGVAQASLSRIETGTMTGTVESHEKIAEALGVGLAELYTGVDGRYEQLSYLTHNQDRKVTQQSQGVRIELLTQDSSKKKITPLLVTLAGGKKTELSHQERGVEKFLLVLEGEVKVKVEKETYTLAENETLYFDASLPHQIINAGSHGAKVFLAVSPSKL